MPTRSRVDCFAFPLEPDAMELLSAWQCQHHYEFMRVRASFVDLRVALNNGTPEQKAAKLMRALTYWEGLMLEAYDKVAYNLVPTLKGGYGTPTTICEYKKATNSLARHSNNLRRLRAYYDKVI